VKNNKSRHKFNNRRIRGVSIKMGGEEKFVAKLNLSPAVEQARS